MRYLFGFICVLLLSMWPQRLRAQASETETTSEPSAEEAAPSSEATQAPSLELKLDDAGVEVVPTPPRTADGHTLEQMNVRVKRVKVGLVVSSLVMVVGAVVAIGGAVSSVSVEPDTDSGRDAVTITGVSLWAGGAVGMIATGILLRRCNRDRDWLLDDYYRLGLQPPSPDDEDEPSKQADPSGPRVPPYRRR